MKVIVLCSVLIIVGSYAFGQNLVGYNNTEIRKFMKENRKDMHFNKVKNSMFSYLKYTDNSDSQTILFFLTNDSICKGVRVICDNSLSREKLRELDKNYRRIGENRWIDNQNGKSYLIRFKEEEWSCSITIEPEI